MPGVFVFSEHPALARQLLTPALELKAALGQPLVALTLDEGAAADLAALGADRVLVVKASPCAPEALAPALAAFLAKEGASVVLVGATLRGKHLAAHLAACIQAGLSTDARTLRLEGDRLVTTRVLYGGLAIGEEAVALPAVATVPARAFLPPPRAPAPGTVATLELDVDARITVTGLTPLASEGVDLGSATRLVAVGRGFRKQEDLGLARDLASALGADLACTRGLAEDEKWLPIERTIGISGQTVTPELYLAAGLSGQVQHMVGCREAKVIVAVNSDERAPIFEAADFGIVGDLYTILPLLTAALQR